MADRSAVDAQIVHIVFADVVEYVKHGLESKNEIDQVLRASVEAEREIGGVLTTVDNGDGFFLVFDGDPRRAADAALRLHDRFSKELAVRVRIGAHSGVSFLRKDLRGGINLTGPAVEQAQRTMAASNGEYPLVSESFYQILKEFESWKLKLGSPRLAKLKGGHVAALWRLGEQPSQPTFLNGTAHSIEEPGIKVTACEAPNSLAEIGKFAEISAYYSGAVYEWGGRAHLITDGELVDEFESAQAAFKELKALTELSPETNPGVRITREADRQLQAAIEKNVSFILVRSARYTGKTTLLVHGKKYAESIGYRGVFHDFRSDGQDVIADQAACYLRIVQTLFAQLKLDQSMIEELWVSDLGLNSNLERCVEYALAEVESSLFWAWDEAERLLHQSFADDLFGLLRSWHNRRAWEENSIWSRLTIAFTYRMDARSVIQNQQQSPFNVGIDVVLHDFSVAELGEINRQLGNRLVQGADIDRVMKLTSGHPMLTNTVFDILSKGGQLNDLEAGNIPTDSRLKLHLDDLWRVISADGALSEACRLVIAGRAGESVPATQLVDLGVIQENASGQFEFRGGIYDQFFKGKYL